jgi:hypothetical protein
LNKSFRETNSKDALLGRIFDDAEQMRKKPETLGRTTDSLIYRAQNSIGAEGTQFEHL